MDEAQKNKLEEELKQVEVVLENLDKKDFTLYFFTLDTKGNPTAGIANIYEHVKVLNELGYKAAILHEKNDYKIVGDENQNGVTDWLGEEYGKLPHLSIESQELKVTPADYIIIPEIFSTIMDQVKDFPCKKIVFSQSYDYLLELLPIGKRWNVDYGFHDVITTSVKQAKHVSNLFPSINTHVVPVSIPEYFKDSDKPKLPIVTVVTRTPGEAAKIAKSFYLQYPMYKWITFKELRGLSRRDFAEELGKSCLAVWIDDSAGFGTFPLEAMESNTPIIGKIPNLIPEWMETTDKDGKPQINNNGVWTNTTINIPELISSYMKLWFEDNIPTDLLNAMGETKGSYTPEKQKEVLSSVYEGIIANRKIELNNIKTNIEEALAPQGEVEPSKA